MRVSDAVRLAVCPVVFGGTLALGFWSAPYSHGDTGYMVDHGTAGMDGSVPGPVPVVALTSIDDVDVLPVCQEEDCSDVPLQTGMWLDADTGNWYLERGVGATWLVVDDTASGLARGVNAWDGYGTYTGGWN